MKGFARFCLSERDRMNQPTVKDADACNAAVHSLTGRLLRTATHFIIIKVTMAAATVLAHARETRFHN